LLVTYYKSFAAFLKSFFDFAQSFHAHCFKLLEHQHTNAVCHTQDCNCHWLHQHGVKTSEEMAYYTDSVWKLFQSESLPTYNARLAYTAITVELEMVDDYSFLSSANS